MSQGNVRRCVAASCFAIAVATGGSAWAQEAPEEGLADTDIVVTATRREERAVDVPIAVSAVGGDKLDILNSSGLDVRFLSSRVPSLQIESSFGRTFPRFYIRGLGNTDFDPNSAQPVSVVYDDVALENPMLKSFPVFDLASVEVLRGPQGTLFGRNTPAGVVKLNSMKPGDTWSGKVSLSAATYNTVNVEGAVGGPLGGGFGFRLSGLVQRRDNWVKNTAIGNPGVLADAKLEGYNDRAARLLLSYEGGGFEALVNVHGRKLDGTPRLFRAGLFQKGSNKFSAGFRKDEISLDGITSQALEQWGTNLHLSYKADGLGTFYSVTAYERATVESSGDIDGGACYAFIPGCTLPNLGVAAFPVNTGGTTSPKEFSQEIRFVSEDMGGFIWQVGGYYFRQKLFYEELAFDGGTIVSDVVHNNKNRNYGLFASGEYKVSPEFTLRAGVRYSNDKKRDTISGQAQFPAVTLPLTNRVSDDNVSWDVSATYTVAPDINLYARFATGYLGPAIQDRVNFGSVPSVAGKQTTISGEAGIKGSMPGLFDFAFDGYWYRTKDLQLTAVGGANNSAQLLSADKAVGYGLEAELSARPTENLVLTLSGSYNHTEIKDPDLVVAACGGGCTMLDPLSVVNGTTVAAIDGNRLPQAPRWVANATLSYTVPVSDTDAIFFFTDWAYRSSINYFLYEAAEFRGRSLLEGGAKVGYRSGGLEVAAFARNITNQIRSISAIDFNNLTGMINEPRIIGGEVRFAF